MNVMMTKFNEVAINLCCKLGITTTSRASKVAKMFVLLVVYGIVFAQPVHAGAAFITEALDMLGLVVVAIGGGLGVWGIVNLLEGYGNDNPGSKSQGMKQLMAGGGLVILGIALPAMLEGLLEEV